LCRFLRWITISCFFPFDLLNNPQIEGSNYPLDRLEADPTGVRLKDIIEHAYEVGYLTKDQFNKLREVFVGN